MDTTGRLEYVDVAKAIGVMLVVLSHTDAYELMDFASCFYVPVFFFCSGYMYRSGGTFRVNVKKRFVKLMKPYFFFNALLLLCFWNFSLRDIVGVFYSRYCLFLPDVVPNVKFLTSGNYPLWFLTSMFVSYLLFYILVYLDRYKWLLAVMFLLFTFAMDQLPILLPWSIDTAFLMSLVMYAGKVYRETEGKKNPELVFWPVTIALLVIYIVSMLLVGDVNISVRKYGTSFLVYFVSAVSGSALLVNLSRLLEKSWVGRCLASIGRHSLTIFCIEILFIYYGRLVIQFMVSPEVHWLTPKVIGLVEWVIALIGGYLMSLLLLKIPTTRRLLS